MNAHLLSARMPAPTRADWAWAAVAGFFVVGALFSASGALWDAAFEDDWSGVFGLPITALVAQWLVGGSWRRTIWGGRDGIRARVESEER